MARILGTCGSTRDGSGEDLARPGSQDHLEILLRALLFLRSACLCPGLWGPLEWGPWLSGTPRFQEVHLSGSGVAYVTGMKMRMSPFHAVKTWRWGEVNLDQPVRMGRAAALKWGLPVERTKKGFYYLLLFKIGSAYASEN